MSENVVELGMITKLDIPAEKVLRRAIDAELDHVLILGWHDGETLYAASTTSDVGKLLQLLETFKHNLMSGEYA